MPAPTFKSYRYLERTEKVNEKKYQKYKKYREKLWKVLDDKFENLPALIRNWQKAGKTHLLSYNQLKSPKWIELHGRCNFFIPTGKDNDGAGSRPFTDIRYHSSPLNYKQAKDATAEYYFGKDGDIRVFALLKALKPQKEIDRVLKKWEGEGVAITEIQDAFLRFIAEAATDALVCASRKMHKDLLRNDKEAFRTLKRIKTTLLKYTTYGPELEIFLHQTIAEIDRARDILPPLNPKHRPSQEPLNKFLATLARTLKEKTRKYHWQDIGYLMHSLFPKIFRGSYHDVWMTLVRKRVKYYQRTHRRWKKLAPKSLNF